MSHLIDRRAHARPGSTPVTIPIKPESYAFLQAWIVRASGIVLDEGKAYLLESRLATILESEGFHDFESLCRRLKAGGDRELERRVVDAMTTNETTFFRDLLPFDALKEHILPGMIRNRRANTKLTFWSAAASSGQEAYSLAIVLREMGLGHHEVEILATDLSHGILKKAKDGRYGVFEMGRGLPPDLLSRYFSREQQDWQVNDDIRRMVRFDQFDLRQTMHGKGPFDMILCRNVFIYFDAATKAQILTNIRQRLLPGGFLLLGGAETVNSLTSFKRTLVGQASFYMAC